MRTAKTAATFHPKSSWQKDDCINANCPNPSTLEARCSDGDTSSAVRCCKRKICKDLAAKIAQRPFED